MSITGIENHNCPPFQVGSDTREMEQTAERVAKLNFTDYFITAFAYTITTLSFINCVVLLSNISETGLDGAFNGLKFFIFTLAAGSVAYNYSCKHLKINQG